MKIRNGSFWDLCHRTWLQLIKNKESVGFETLNEPVCVNSEASFDTLPYIMLVLL